MALSKISLACAGGGVEGAVYEIGALCALQDAISGLQFTNMHTYVGVSAGALITSNLANGITAREMSLAILSHGSGVNPITPELLFKPAVSEYSNKLLKLPNKLASVIRLYLQNVRDTSLLGALSELSDLIPIGIFDNKPLHDYFREMYSQEGRTNDFRELTQQLLIVATDLNSGEIVRFGDDSTKHIPISKAIQASTALPGVYLPVSINGREYVDGVARRTVHASLALEAGSSLVICVNPIVPLNNDNADSQLKKEFGSISDRGLTTILSQTFRTMIHSRMNVGIKSYETKYPNSDVILFEPHRDDYRMFYNNIFSFSTRREVCEHAYTTTMEDLRRRKDQLDPILKKNGLSLRDDVIFDEDRKLYSPLVDTTSAGLRELDEALSKLDEVIGKMEHQHSLSQVG